MEAGSPASTPPMSSRRTSAAATPRTAAVPLAIAALEVSTAQRALEIAAMRKELGMMS